MPVPCVVSCFAAGSGPGIDIVFSFERPLCGHDGSTRQLMLGDGEVARLLTPEFQGCSRVWAYRCDQRPSFAAGKLRYFGGTFHDPCTSAVFNLEGALTIRADVPAPLVLGQAAM